MEFYQDNDGVSVKCLSKKLGSFIATYLDEEEVDSHFVSKVNYLSEHDEDIFDCLKVAVKVYGKEKYGYFDEYPFQVMVMYINRSSDEYGVILRWDGDVEHGIGIKMEKDNVLKIGSAELSFS